LTEWDASFKNSIMPLTSGRKRSPGLHRLIAAGLFFFVFFLPLHAHYFASDPQITKDCACLHGSRTQMASAPVAADWAPMFLLSAVFSHEPQVISNSSVGILSIRAPPAI
jgi:hypothetical protein